MKWLRLGKGKREKGKGKREKGKGKRGKGKGERRTFLFKLTPIFLLGFYG
jgi:hypothetical protein